MLHERELSFIHPRTEKEMSLESPLPEDFRGAVKRLHIGNNPENTNDRPFKFNDHPFQFSDCTFHLG